MAIDADTFPVVDVNTTSVDFSLLMPNKNLYVRTNKSKVNLLQVFCPQEKQLIQAMQGMSNLKIDRSVTSNRYNSHMARVLRSKAIMSRSIKGKMWHILLKNLFSPIR